MNKQRKIDALVQEFATNVMAHRDSVFDETRSSNIYTDRYVAAFDNLCKLGNEGRDALVPLMYTGRSDVRGTVAAHLLRYRHAEAKKVLEELAQGEGFDAFCAQQSLERWAEGTWMLDPED